MQNRNDFLDLVIYQVYPRSFCDSDGNGIGDIKGIQSKLGYLQELGINAIWLSPCYKSPNYDNGYDISDYRDIQPDFGTFEDWKSLIDDMHSRGMKLFMDLVVNHTSSHHFWFKEASKSRNNPYHDYYIWADKPRNDWKSVFGGSAWEYNKQTDEYYLHSFAIQQPDLNWENPKVRKEACDIVDYWVKLGVDGFRCDVLDFIAKDFENNLMLNGPKLHEYINLLFGRDNVKHIFTIGECQSDEKSIADICGETRGELTTVFQFDHISLGRENKYTPSEINYNTLRDVLVKWQNFSAKNNLLYMLFTDNHDQPFYLSRMGKDEVNHYECATFLASIFYLLKGIPLVYQGQEFGSLNSYYEDISDFDDIETVNYYNEQKSKKDNALLIKEINYGSRDNTRRPIAWTNDETSSFGFTTGKPWLKMPTKAKKVNLEKDLKSENSIFYFYKRLFDLRKREKCIRRGDFIDLTSQKDCFVFLRRDEKDEIIVLCNFDKEQKIKLPDLMKNYKYELLLSNYTHPLTFDETLRPFEVLIYKKVSL